MDSGLLSGEAGAEIQLSAHTVAVPKGIHEAASDRGDVDEALSFQEAYSLEFESQCATRGKTILISAQVRLNDRVWASC